MNILIRDLIRSDMPPNSRQVAARPPRPYNYSRYLQFSKRLIQSSISLNFRISSRSRSRNFARVASLDCAVCAAPRVEHRVITARRCRACRAPALIIAQRTGQASVMSTLDSKSAPERGLGQGRSRSAAWRPNARGGSRAGAGLGLPDS